MAGGFATCIASSPVLAAEHDIVDLSSAGLATLDDAFAPGRPALSEPIFDAAPGAIAMATVSLQAEPTSPPDVYGPQESASLAADARPTRSYASFGEDVSAIKWEFAAVMGYYTATNAPKLFKNPRLPHFKSEGWFGRSTNNVGVDKLAHVYSAYVVSELFYARLKHKTGDAPGIQYTAAALASGVMLWSELFDSIEPDSGWSWEDVAMNTAGAGLSILRNSVPDLDQKLDFRLMIEPNEDIYSVNGKPHFEQQRYFFALKSAGFEAFERSPLRFLELHLGYHGDDFRLEDRAAGITPKRHIFVGIGLNLRELLFKNSRSRVGRAAGEVLDYFQLPYTAVHTHVTD
ncbi:DUF2279 domain-containing protein [Pelagerythrobacter sp.]|uniref:DUF2279 domain-containing protein n=1 Tax=Pelagerythrobacter sp. TaxID=2800702 RepID=UPI0035AE8E15